MSTIPAFCVESDSPRALPAVGTSEATRFFLSGATFFPCHESASDCRNAFFMAWALRDVDLQSPLIGTDHTNRITSLLTSPIPLVGGHCDEGGHDVADAADLVQIRQEADGSKVYACSFCRAELEQAARVAEWDAHLSECRRRGICPICECGNTMEAHEYGGAVCVCDAWGGE